MREVPVNKGLRRIQRKHMYPIVKVLGVLHPVLQAEFSVIEALFAYDDYLAGKFTV